MEVVWSDLALTQLDEVLDYVEEHFGLLTSQEVLHNILEKTDELAQYSTHGIYDARYTSWVSGQNIGYTPFVDSPKSCLLFDRWRASSNYGNSSCQTVSASRNFHDQTLLGGI